MTDPTVRIAAVLSDRYRIERELGAGGMATVYLAEDVRHHRKVAIKVLHAELSAILGPERFLKEIELTANLQHPHILPLFDSGSADGLLYYVMPYVEGETLRRRLERERQLPVADAVRIASEVASALDFAHRRGVVHRDVKPENILLQDGQALVADFGIALAVEQAGGTRMTQPGLSLGTPQYMAPEQAMGEREISARTDIYALGAITYEMLAGEPPFTGPTSQAIIARVITEEPRALLLQRRSIPASVESAVLTALEKLPADRFGTAAEFARNLAIDEPARRMWASPRAVHTQRARFPLPLTLAAVSIVASAVAFFAGRRSVGAAAPAVSFGRATKVTRGPGLEIAPALSPDGRSVAYATGNTTHIQIFVRQVSGGRALALTDDSLDVQTDPQWSPDGTRILFLSGGGVFSAPASGGSARPEVPVSPGEGVVSAAWAPDGQAIVYTIRDSVFTRTRAGRSRLLAELPEPALCRWAPDGALIACASGNAYYSRVGRFFGNVSPSRVMLIRVNDGSVVPVTDSTSANQSPAWSRDGHWLYYLSDEFGPRDIFARRIDDGRPSGEPVRLTTGLDAHSISTSADGTRFAYDRYVETSNVWSLPFPPRGASEASATPVTVGTQTVNEVAPSADGKWLYYDSDVSGTSELYRMHVPRGAPEQITFDSTDDFAPMPSPDGTRVAFHSWRSGSRDIYVLPLNGRPVQTVTASPLQEYKPRWSPDGAAITYTLYGGGGVYVVRQGANGVWGSPVQRTGGRLVSSNSASWPTWSPDGRWIAYVNGFAGGSLLIVSPDSGAPRTVLDSAKSGMSAEYPVWSGDSRTLYFKSHDARGIAAFWSIPITGGTPTLLTRLNDPDRPSYRPEWSVGAGRMYFQIADLQSDVWVMQAAQR